MLRGDEWIAVAWANVVVGDIVHVLDGMEFPADIVALSSSYPNGEIYIDTANLDGCATNFPNEEWGFLWASLTSRLLPLLLYLFYHSYLPI